jgi:hypothetical protein
LKAEIGTAMTGMGSPLALKISNTHPFSPPVGCWTESTQSDNTANFKIMFWHIAGQGSVLIRGKHWKEDPGLA